MTALRTARKIFAINLPRNIPIFLPFIKRIRVYQLQEIREWKPQKGSTYPSSTATTAMMKASFRQCLNTAITILSAVIISSKAGTRRMSENTLTTECGIKKILPSIFTAELSDRSFIPAGTSFIKHQLSKKTELSLLRE